MGVTILLELMGGVALLLWGLHMVQSGIIRAFGAKLRRWLSSVLRNRTRAFLAGIGVTSVLQSSTATAFMLSSFTASGLVQLAPAMAVMLGANVGTTLIVQVLSFDTSAFAPVMILVGVISFKRASRTIYRDLGRVAIGLGLMLLALENLVQALSPIEQAPVVRELFMSITGDPILTILIGAALTWASHSSVATVLLTMSLAYSEVLTPTAAMALVLGANLGSAINPLIEGVGSGNPADRRLPVGNLINRIVGCAIFVPLLDPIGNFLHSIELNPGRAVADFHTLFNLIMAGLFIVPLMPFSRLLEKLLPDRRKTADPGAPLYLDESAIETPAVALTTATRETMRMGDLVDAMLDNTMKGLLTNDRNLISDVGKKDDIVDRLHEAVKLYVVKVTQQSLDDRQSHRAMEIMGMAINLEHIGDIIEKNLVELANKKIKRQLQFSKDGADDLLEFQSIVRDNLRLAMTVFLTSDTRLAKELLAQKSRISELELAASENHMQRLREGRIESIETSSLHLDILRDFKRIHSHITAAAYPTLEAAGELQAYRQHIALLQAQRTKAQDDRKKR